MLRLTLNKANRARRALLLSLLAVWVPVAVGSTIPDIALHTLNGAVTRPAERKGRLMVLAYVRERQVLSRNLLIDLQAEYTKLTQKQIDVLAVAQCGTGPASPATSSREAQPTLPCPSDQWRSLVTEEGLQFPFAMDRDGRLLEAIGSKALPVTIIVDGKGKVASVIFLHRASFRRDLWRRLQQAGLPDAGDARRRVAVAEERQNAVHAMRGLVRRGQTDEALSAIAQLRSRYPKRFAIRMWLGEALIELGRPAEAVEDFLAAGELEPGSLRVKLWLGIARARNGDDQRADSLLNGVAEALPDGWRALGELGLMQHRQGNLEEAARLLRMSIDKKTDVAWATGSAWPGSEAPILEVLNPDGSPGRPIISRSAPHPVLTLFWRTDDEASLGCLRTVHDYHARFGDGGLAVVAVNVDKYRFHEADRARVYDQARAAGFERPTFGPAGTRAADFSPRGSTDSAATPPRSQTPRGPTEPKQATSPTVWLDAGLESFARYDVHAIPTTVLIDPHGVVARRVVGGDLTVLEEPLSAMLAADSARVAESRAAGRPGEVSTTPVSGVSARRLAMARHLARQGRIQGAIDSVRRSLAESPAHDGALALLGRLLSASGQLDEAAKVLAEAVQFDPLEPGLLTAYGDCLAGQGLEPKAVEWYHRALKVCPGFAPAHVGLGQALVDNDSPRENHVRELQLAVKLNPHDRHAWVALGEILESAHRLDEAVKAYTKAYQLRWDRAASRRF